MIGSLLLIEALLVPIKATVAPILIAQSFSTDGNASAPWPGADWHVAGKLSHPALEFERYILEGATHRALAFGPTIEQRGSALLMFGHRDTHFAALEPVQTGDTFLYHPAGTLRPRAYRVARIWTAHKDALTLPGAGHEHGILMVTCYPFGGFQTERPLRHLVWAVPVQDSAPIA